MLDNTKFPDWTFKTKHKQVECRKTFSGLALYGDRPINESGQVLLIVSNGNWKYKKSSGKQEIRLSMNGPCVMSNNEMKEIISVIDYAKLLLKGSASITVNGEKFEWGKQEIGYKDIAILAGKDPEITYSVTYVIKNHGKMLEPTEPDIIVQDGMKFNIYHTGDA